VISRIIEPQSAITPVSEGARSLLSAAAVRGAAHRVLRLALAGSLEDWTVDRSRLPQVADFVAAVVSERYPSLRPPVHARWRHFVFAGRDLWSEIAADRAWASPAAAARAAFDLAITSVLLDAGAGPTWRYHDAATGLTAARSEGLALASLRWFERGGFADDPGDPLRADAAGLDRVDARAVEAAFQSSGEHTLQGAPGRALLLNRLGAAVRARPDLFALEDDPRPGGLFDALVRRASGARRIPAAMMLEVLLEGLGSIWPGRAQLDGVPLGDCWLYPPLATGDPRATEGDPAQGRSRARGGALAPESFVPLHKLSQWLAYSLIEPLERAGLQVVDVGALTGLAEYRNGGLFVDLGAMVPRDATALSRVHDVASGFVVGWRAMTVALLDEIAPMVATRLGLTVAEFPLARVLEGGTWAAGRLLARRKRADAGPPFRISSDGTVF
jgi:Protein of unknown function (DUF1688)